MNQCTIYCLYIYPLACCPCVGPKGVRVGASGGLEHEAILWTPFSNIRIGHLEVGTPVMGLQPGSTEHRIVTLGACACVASGYMRRPLPSFPPTHTPSRAHTAAAVPTFHLSLSSTGPFGHYHCRRRTPTPLCVPVEASR
jgi:hypothetical protein